MTTDATTPAPSRTAPRSIRRVIRAAAAGIVVSAPLAIAAGPNPATARRAHPGQAPWNPSCELASAPPRWLEYPGQAPPAASNLRRLADRLRPTASNAPPGRVPGVHPR